eukprot:214220_1
MLVQKQHISLVTIGDVDSGKSTLCGRLLFELGKINKRDLEKYKQAGNVSSQYAYHMDKSREERERGVTIHVGWDNIQTASFHYSLIDTPGHRDFIKNAITGMSCADVAILVVPANERVFEASIATPNHKKGQLMGQSMLVAKLSHISGIEQLIVCINKMDHPSVNYSQNRYDSVKSEIDKMLTKIGYKTKKIPFIPVSAFKGDNLAAPSDNMKWYKGFTVKV